MIDGFSTGCWQITTLKIVQFSCSSNVFTYSFYGFLTTNREIMYFLKGKRSDFLTFAGVKIMILASGENFSIFDYLCLTWKPNKNVNQDIKYENNYGLSFIIGIDQCYFDTTRNCLE